MAIDYEQLANTAKTLVDANGRAITAIRFNQTPTDSNKPWNGPTDPDGTPSATASVYGCFVPPSGGASLGIDMVDADLLKRVSQICLVAPGTVSPPFDLKTADEIVDSGVHWKVEFVRELKPNTVVLLYIIGVSR